MNFCKKITVFSLALAIPFSFTLSAAHATEAKSTNNEFTHQVNYVSESQFMAMKLLKEGKVVESGSETISFNGSESGTLKIATSVSPTGDTVVTVNNDSPIMLAATTWDGSYTSTYTIPKYIMAAGAGAISTYLLYTLGVGVVLSAAISNAIVAYATANVKVVSEVKYKWITKYTKATYQASSKIYADDVYKKTITTTWTAEVDNLTD